MKPYPEATRDPGEITFNKELSSPRVAIECAFGRLKSRWRILQKRLDSRITFSVKISVACAVLKGRKVVYGRLDLPSNARAFSLTSFEK